MALRSKQSFAVGRRIIRKGQLVSDSDPLVAGREDLFESPDAHVEAATAAPGEARLGTRRKADGVISRGKTTTTKRKAAAAKAQPAANDDGQ